MNQNRDVNKYAKALFLIAKKSDDFVMGSNRLKLLNKIYSSSSDFRLLLKTKRINSDDKITIIKKIFFNSLSSLEIDMLCFLIKDGNTNLLEHIIKRFNFLYDSAEFNLKLIISTAEKIEEEHLSGIVENISNKLNKKLEIVQEVVPEIIGGVRFRIGNSIIDGSISNRLQKLDKVLKEV